MTLARVGRQQNERIPTLCSSRIYYIGSENRATYNLNFVQMSKQTSQFPLPLKSVRPNKVLDVDEKTPDAHVLRDSRLIRLTGAHPFNCEAPLSLLYDSGFLTPVELWFVRNHGAVPQVSDADVRSWQFTIEGLVDKPMTLTLAQLLTLKQVTVPVTMVCAGNRRKEQNVVRKGHGFNWGSAGVSTALFTGVLIHEVLKFARPQSSAKYMCMEGADKLPNGHYGTSIRLSVAMNPAMSVMLAHAMNGEPLRPDHGRPLRVVIPGQIGGRSVKWLKRIIITDKPSDNWYHIYDNRVLPTMITPEVIAEDKSWYLDERYALYNLNVQSVTCCPAHGELVRVDPESDYTVRGYAYNGGGVRIGRVEISLDQGHTWKLAMIDYPEDRYREASPDSQLFGGKLDMPQRELSFCWCFWRVDIAVKDLSHAEDLVVRAMDESMNAQPRDMYWNLLSMLNNCWHRVTITDEQDGAFLRFEHPTLPALQEGGWMEKVKNNGGDLTNGHWGTEMSPIAGVQPNKKPSGPTIQMTNANITRIITEEELAEHNRDGDAWFAVRGHVYDASEYLSEHPGGRDSIVLASGMDATDDFMAIHSDRAKAMLAKYHIGVLQATATDKDKPADQTNTDGQQRDVFLQQRYWTPAMLRRKTILNHNCIRLTFALQHDSQKLGLPIGKHILLRCKSCSGERVVRPYTPISKVDHVGEFDLVVKLYKACGDRSAGKMSACLDSLNEGDMVECKGPFGDLVYQRDGVFSINGVTRRVKRLTLVAGGSGITPIYQLLRYARSDGIECDTIYCNETEEDILLRKELDGLGSVRHCLAQPPREWTGLSGHISRSMLGHAHDGLFLACGPPEMMDDMYKTAAESGWNVQTQFFHF